MNSEDDKDPKQRRTDPKSIDVKQLTRECWASIERWKEEDRRFHEMVEGFKRRCEERNREWEEYSKERERRWRERFGEGDESDNRSD